MESYIEVAWSEEQNIAFQKGHQKGYNHGYSTALSLFSKGHIAAFQKGQSATEANQFEAQGSPTPRAEAASSSAGKVLPGTGEFSAVPPPAILLGNSGATELALPRVRPKPKPSCASRATLCAPAPDEPGEPSTGPTPPREPPPHHLVMIPKACASVSYQPQREVEPIGQMAQADLESKEKAADPSSANSKLKLKAKAQAKAMPRHREGGDRAPGHQEGRKGHRKRRDHSASLPRKRRERRS